ncbi:polysaccharide deacetylase family protein [Shewanella sp. ENK2]|uniref:polysaccharide deacetylase family protein n=1 Tax=Shewanella sp. ENK2 TaxID=2775245 RepID=UPI003749CF83
MQVLCRFALIIVVILFKIVFTTIFTTHNAYSANINPQFSWPNHYQAAVSLSYDDALMSQLEYAIPALDKYNFKASFYLTLANPGTEAGLQQWRAIAANGHELGNHTLFHACSKKLDDREWVAPHNNLDSKTVLQLQQEVMTANTFLRAIDQQTQRTFTPPCGDFIAANGNYIDAIRNNFVAIKGYNPQFPPKFDLLLMPDNVDGQTLIDFVEKAKAQGGVANIIFHGIEGDYLTVSNQAHKELLQYLADNQDILWVDSYLNIMQHVQQQFATAPVTVN